jgi:vancomycin resistance protein YoaR
MLHMRTDNGKLHSTAWALAVVFAVLGFLALCIAAGTARDEGVTKGFGAVLSAFTSRFDASATARSHNIALALEKIKGTVLKAGEEFSFNTVVGERSEEAGFLPAPVLGPVGTEVGAGGGVCQVASTLYNAALLADLEITCRTPHSCVVPYLEAGRDATVGDFRDLRFRNTRSEPVMIDGTAADGRLVFRILSDKEADCEIRIETQKQSLRPQEQDRRNSRLPAEVKTNGEAGVYVRVYRVRCREGVEYQRELVSEDFYEPGHMVRGGD